MSALMSFVPTARGGLHAALFIAGRIGVVSFEFDACCCREFMRIALLFIAGRSEVCFDFAFGCSREFDFVACRQFYSRSVCIRSSTRISRWGRPFRNTERDAQQR